METIIDRIDSEFRSLNIETEKPWWAIQGTVVVDQPTYSEILDQYTKEVIRFHKDNSFTITINGGAQLDVSVKIPKSGTRYVSKNNMIFYI
jgi:hypothetical protein